jgi:hypothetical protein
MYLIRLTLYHLAASFALSLIICCIASVSFVISVFIVDSVIVVSSFFSGSSLSLSSLLPLFHSCLYPYVLIVSLSCLRPHCVSVLVIVSVLHVVRTCPHCFLSSQLFTVFSDVVVASNLINVSNLTVCSSLPSLFHCFVFSLLVFSYLIVSLSALFSLSSFLFVTVLNVVSVLIGEPVLTVVLNFVCILTMSLSSFLSLSSVLALSSLLSQSYFFSVLNLVSVLFVGPVHTFVSVLNVLLFYFCPNFVSDLNSQCSLSPHWWICPHW